MGERNSNQEIEIKLRLPSARWGRRLLRESGFRVKRRRVLESNVVYDTPSGALRASGQLLRLRRTGRRALLTYKGPAVPGRYKSREERETTVADADEIAVILTRLGYQPSFRYEKYRTEYRRPDGGGLILLDETPIGDFFELEGQPEWIDHTAAELGFSLSSYITETYGSLFLLERPAGTNPAAMLFGS